MASLNLSSTAIDTAASSSGLQDLHDAVDIKSSSSDDAPEMPPRLSDPALEITEIICNWCKDDLVTYEKDANGSVYPQWCLECTEGRIAEREAREMEEASAKIILDSDDEMVGQGGGARGQ